MISLFFWVLLSRIDRNSTWDAVKWEVAVRAMTDAFGSIIGAFALMAALGAVLAMDFYPFPSGGFFAGIGVLLSSPLLLLLAVGKRKSLYLVTIPAMIAPIAVNQFVFRYDYSNGEVMIMLTIASAIVMSLAVKRHYAQKSAKERKSQED